MPGTEQESAPKSRRDDCPLYPPLLPFISRVFTPSATSGNHFSESSPPRTPMRTEARLSSSDKRRAAAIAARTRLLLFRWKPRPLGRGNAPEIKPGFSPGTKLHQAPLRAAPEARL